MGFLGHAAYGRIARAGLHALQERQHATGDFQLTAELQQAFDVILVFWCRSQNVSPAFFRPPVSGCRGLRRRSRGGATRWRGGAPGRPSGERSGVVIHISPQVFRLWNDDAAKIAQLELLAVLQGASPPLCVGLPPSGLWTISPGEVLQQRHVANPPYRGHASCCRRPHFSSVERVMAYVLLPAVVQWMTWLYQPDRLSRAG